MVVVDEYWRLPPFPKESLALTKAAFSVGYHQKRLKRLKKKARVVHYLAVVETSCGKTPRRGVFRKFVSGVVISRPASRTTFQQRQVSPSYLPRRLPLAWWPVKAATVGTAWSVPLKYKGEDRREGEKRLVSPSCRGYRT